MKRKYKRIDLIKRFWDKVDIRSEDECWEWKGAKSQGYGVISIDYQLTNAHRFAWELHNKKKIPKGKEICHTCDNPPCCNPNHLFLGTHKDNMNDCMDKGRFKKGFQLHEGEVWLIKRLHIHKYKFGIHHLFSLTFVSKMFHTSIGTIQRIWEEEDLGRIDM